MGTKSMSTVLHALDTQSMLMSQASTPAVSEHGWNETCRVLHYGHTGMLCLS
jgi:hypothetical protein